jgi:predicted nucleic acid-binding protein
VNKALLDTDIYSEILKAVDPTVARNATTYRQTFGVLTLSVITIMEITKGCQRSQAAWRMRRFLNAVAQEEVLPLGTTAAELAGRIAGDLDRTAGLSTHPGRLAITRSYGGRTPHTSALTQSMRTDPSP